jgi:sigma-B regulation protein RsbU (phosphoserine phosphatase)
MQRPTIHPSALSASTSASGASLAPAISDSQMRMVLDVSRLLAVTTDIDELLCRIAQAATVLLGCERASIFLHDPRTNELWTKVALKSGEIRIPAHTGIAGHCFSTAEIICVHNPYHDPRFNPEPDRNSGFVTRNLLTAPMLNIDGQPLGVIQGVNKIDATFFEADLSLIQLLAEQAGVAVQRYNLQVQAVEAMGLRREMELARATQQALLPRNAPVLPWADAAGWNCPASVTGGDCWDMWMLPDGRLGIFLADASGHGIGPALVVSQARTLVRAIADTETNPHELLARVNARLCADLECGRFVTAFLAFLSPDGWLHWSSAGHGPSLLRTQSDGEFERLDPPVQPLGVMDDWDDVAPEPVRLKPGGSLVVVSDGVFEAMTPSGAMFGFDRVEQGVATLIGSPSSAVVNGLCNAVQAWQGAGDPLDDQTIVVVQRRVT